MSFETKEGTECVVRNYRELQVSYTPYSNSLLIFACLRSLAILQWTAPTKE